MQRWFPLIFSLVVVGHGHLVVVDQHQSLRQLALLSNVAEGVVFVGCAGDTVVYHLCGGCETTTCAGNYYMIDKVDYLAAVTSKLLQNVELACMQCRTDCYRYDDAVSPPENITSDCDTCGDECEKYENTEENGYYPATSFIQCQMIYDPNDDTAAPLYAGPQCVGNGTQLRVSVFGDEDCTNVDTTKDVDDYLVNADGTQMKLSYSIWKRVYMPGECALCDDDTLCDILATGSAICEGAACSAILEEVMEPSPAPFTGQQMETIAPSIATVDRPPINGLPSPMPSSMPSSIPTPVPTHQPTLRPTAVPTPMASDVPSDTPSDTPSSTPTATLASIPAPISSDTTTAPTAAADTSALPSVVLSTPPSSLDESQRVVAPSATPRTVAGVESTSAAGAGKGVVVLLLAALLAQCLV